MMASAPAKDAPSSGCSRAGGGAVGNDVTVGGGLVGVGGRRVRVGVGEGVSVGVAVGVGVGVGVSVGSVGEGVTVGVGVVVGVLVGEGVIEGVSDGVSVGTSTNTGTSLAMACTVPIARPGRKSSRARSRRGPTSITSATATKNAPAISTGLSQSCLSGSPQCGHTSKPWLLIVPQ